MARLTVTPEGAALLALSLEASLRSSGRNGRAPSPALRDVAQAVAQAAPGTALRLPALLACIGAEETAQLRGLDPTAGAPLTQQAAALRPTAGSVPVRGPLSTAEVAAMCGIGTEGVRTAIRRGRLAASRDRVTGEWRVELADVERWRGSDAA